MPENKDRRVRSGDLIMFCSVIDSISVKPLEQNWIGGHKSTYQYSHVPFPFNKALASHQQRMVFPVFQEHEPALGALFDLPYHADRLNTLKFKPEWIKLCL